MTPQAMRERRADRYARGQCSACDRPRESESPRCAECRAYQARKMRGYRAGSPAARRRPSTAERRVIRADRFARGQCVHCPNRRLGTSSRCATCLQKAKDYDARKREAKEARSR